MGTQETSRNRRERKVLERARETGLYKLKGLRWEVGREEKKINSRTGYWSGEGGTLSAPVLQHLVVSGYEGIVKGWDGMRER